MRNISKTIYEDEWMIENDFKTNLAWIMIVNSLPDDQGRFELTNPTSLKNKIFMGKGTVEDTLAMLAKFVRDGKLVEYTVGKKHCYQIMNWWRHQISASYMQKSKLPAPDGWVDAWRVNVTGKGKTKNASPNWDERETLAGFITMASVMSSVNTVVQQQVNNTQ
jgi:hypothetical protein